MSEHTGMRRALVYLKNHPKVCKNCKQIIQEMLEKLEQKEAAWTANTFFIDVGIPAT